MKLKELPKDLQDDLESLKNLRKLARKWAQTLTKEEAQNWVAFFDNILEFCKKEEQSTW